MTVDSRNPGKSEKKLRYLANTIAPLELETIEGGEMGNLILIQRFIYICEKTRGPWSKFFPLLGFVHGRFFLDSDIRIDEKCHSFGNTRNMSVAAWHNPISTLCLFSIY